jgi:hypothetical protein
VQTGAISSSFETLASLAPQDEEMGAALTRSYHATPDELKAIDEADASGVATDDEVEAAFRSFRRA